jgi:DnaK suppressor protein
MRLDRYRKLRENLENRRREIQASVPEDGEVVDPEIQLAESKDQTLYRIDQAVEELEAGIYGICIGCQDEIEEARLMALPFVKICGGCNDASEHEADKRQVAQIVRRRFGGLHNQ